MILAKCTMWNVEESGELVVRGCGSVEKGAGLSVLQRVLWSDNFWIMNENKVGMQRTMEELAEEIVCKGMEPKQESFWWTSTQAKEMGGADGYRRRENAY